MGFNKNINSIGEREKLILGVISDVKKSNLSVERYFSTYDVSFSIPQYKRYLKAYKENGINGLY
ncbi:MAG: hypothetical protein CVT90_01385 [Candidatus Altiarchaeales archaeon HGW-Altiarchaeales-3]|nr:MAG: hypothetical protein CVT90_01385 [Candidatus Altiarchaeales archaeon HGW-Altiarchaeales-3]